MRVIVGLGNPGPEYARTRHNVGWMLLDELAVAVGAARFRAEAPVEAAEAFFNGEKVYLLKPQTYMNRSGQALASWLGRFRDIREEIRKGREDAVPPPPRRLRDRGDGQDGVPCDWPGFLVVSDDVNLPLGRMRLRPSGSAGGHNGLKDIEKALGGRGYPRLRLGVGAPPEAMDRADYVLGRFSPGERPVLERVVRNGAAAVVDWMRHGLEAARDKYNGMTPEDGQNAG